MVFRDSTSSRMVVHTLQLPDTQRKLFSISGYLLIRWKVESLVAVRRTDFSSVRNVAGKPEGDKLDAIAVHPEVCLSAVTKCQPTVGPKDGTFTLQYRSAIAFGKAERVTDTEEKIEALRAISQRFLPKHMDAFDEAVQRSLYRTEVVRITLLSPPTGKRKQYDKNGDEMKYGRME